MSASPALGPVSQTSSRATSNADIVTADLDLSDLEDDESVDGNEEAFAIDMKEVTKTGWMYKKGEKFLKAWQQRYFVLKNQMLLYYKSDKDTHPRGVAHLDECEVKDSSNKTKKQFSFEIYHPNRRLFEFYCDTEDERREWVAAIQAAIEASNTTKLAERAQNMRKEIDRLLQKNKRLQNESAERRATIQLEDLRRTETDLHLKQKDREIDSLKAEREELKKRLQALEQSASVPAAAPPAAPTPSEQAQAQQAAEDSLTVKLLETKLHDANGRLEEMAKEIEKLKAEKKVLLKEVKRLRNVEAMATVPE